MKKLTKKDFSERAIKTHGNKYDYSKSLYISGNTELFSKDVLQLDTN